MSPRNIKEEKLGGILMAVIYFSKLNINSNIYDVYRDEKIKDMILNEVFEKMDQKLEIEDDDGVRYKFCDLNKNYDQKTVVGRLVKIFEGENISYNAEKDTVNITPADDCASHITFYFDVYQEQIAFIRRHNFGFRQFNKIFKMILEKYLEDVEFEMYLEHNIDELKVKMEKFKQILKVDVTIIPPNANRDEFAMLFGTNAEEIYEANATKYTQTLTTSSKNIKGINWRTGFFTRMFYGIAKGYGDMNVEGKDHTGTKYRLTSDEDAPFTRPIPDSEKDSLSAFPEVAREYIKELIQQKLKVKLNGGESHSKDN